MSRRNLFLFAMIACVPLALGAALCGCFGEKLALPPVTVTIPLDQAISFGPTASLPAGKDVAFYSLMDGLTCNLPSDDLILDEAKKQLGGTIGGLISVDKVKLNYVLLTANPGSFKTLTSLFLSFITVGMDGVIPMPVGMAANPAGFGQQVKLDPLGDVDLQPILKQDKPACGAAIVTVSGTVPSETVSVNAQLCVTVFLEAGF